MVGKLAVSGPPEGSSGQAVEADQRVATPNLIPALHYFLRNWPSLRISVVSGGTRGKILLSAVTGLLEINKSTASIPTT